MNRYLPPWLDHIPPLDDPKIVKARKADLTPISFDPEIFCAQFSSKHSYYETTLESCRSGSSPCGGGFPCKHMYRLAMELGFIPYDFESDSSKIKYKREGISLSKCVSRLESVGKDAQLELLRLLPALRNGPIPLTDISPTLFTELEIGLLLIRIDQPVEIRIHPDIDKSSYKLLTYLRRKFECSSFFTGTQGEIYIPYGCLEPSFDPNLDITSVHWPDDEITSLLLHHGHDRCSEFNNALSVSPDLEIPADTANLEVLPPDDICSSPAPSPISLDDLLCPLLPLPGLIFTIKGLHSSSPIIWISGKTHRHEASIKAAGGRFSDKQSAWYIKP